jgi:hypothetical protein
MNLTIIHTGKQVSVKKSLYAIAVESLERYLDSVRVDRKQQNDADLNHIIGE